LKKIFGNGYGPKEIKLYKLVQAMAPEQKKTVEKYLVGRGMVRGGGVGQYGGFLGMLASIGVPIAIHLIRKMFGKGMHGNKPEVSERPGTFPGTTLQKDFRFLYRASVSLALQL